MASRHTFQAPSAARAEAARLADAAPRRASTLLLLFELGEMRAELALVLLALAGVALGLGSWWPALAWLEAVGALLALPVVAVVVALRRSIIDTPWLRRSAVAVGTAAALVALAVGVTTLSTGLSLAGSWLAGVLRHLPVAAALLAAAGLALQVEAERRRARSWLLVGSWTALAFALWAPARWDPSQPGWSAIGVLLFAAFAGGGAGGAVSYVIAKRCAAPDPHPRAKARA
jgi:hypothetical protein